MNLAKEIEQFKTLLASMEQKVGKPNTRPESNRPTKQQLADKRIATWWKKKYPLG
jgi:hypothetical protein